MWIRSLISKIGIMVCSNKKYNTDAEYLIDLGCYCLGYKMNLDNPTTLNEKLNWYKLHYRNELMTLCTDKYNVRDYIKSKGLENILLKCYGVFNSISEIDLESLPDSFVIKNTGDSGGVVVCRTKDDFYNKTFAKFALVEYDYSSLFKEWNYQGIKNRIIVEELIDTANGVSPKDYKFFCFHGEPKFLYVASDRNTNCKFDFFDLDWNKIDVLQGHLNSVNVIEKPMNFDKMLDIARVLSKDFPHVRVDLYNVDGKIYFGELTFFHLAGLKAFYPRKYDYIFGEYFDINKI